jgi:hypothetical protein
LGENRPEVFCGELTGTLKHRPEGLRLKHTVNGNSLKIYDKEAQVLRVETTINRPAMPTSMHLMFPLLDSILIPYHRAYRGLRAMISLSF